MGQGKETVGEQEQAYQSSARRLQLHHLCSLHREQPELQLGQHLSRPPCAVPSSTLIVPTMVVIKVLARREGDDYIKKIYEKRL